jgi:hypothetical protein
LLGTEYGLTHSEAIAALKAANITPGDTISSIKNSYNSSSVEAIQLMYQAGYSPAEIGSVIASNYDLGNAAILLQTLLNAKLNESEIYAAAGAAYAHKDVAMAMLNAGITMGSLLSAIKASGAQVQWLFLARGNRRNVIGRIRVK